MVIINNMIEQNPIIIFTVTSSISNVCVKIKLSFVEIEQ